MRKIILFLMVLCAVLAFDIVIKNNKMEALEKENHRLMNKVEAYEYAEWEWQNFKARLRK